MKQKLVNFFDFAGLTWFVPFVKLCYGDEPQEQLREIVRMFGLPAIALVLFFSGWSLMSKHIKTSVGALPTPSYVWSQAQAMWAFHNSESINRAEFSYYNDIRSRLSANYEELSKATGETGSIDNKRAKLTGELKREIDIRSDKILKLSATVKAITAARDTKIAELKDRFVKAKRFSYLNNGTIAKDVEGNAELSVGALSKIAEVAQVRIAVFESNALAYYSNGNNSLKSLAKKVTRIDGYLTALNAAKELALQDAGTEKKIKTLIKKRDAYLKQLTKVKDYSGNGTIVDYIKTSIITVLFGFGLAAVVAIPLGILCGMSNTVMTALNPLIQTFRPVSPLAWILITIQVVDGIFVGDNALHGDIVNNTFLHAGITVALCSLWATLSNTALGVSSVDPDHLNVAKVLKLSWFDRVFKIIVPSAVPYIFTGLRITLGVGWMVLIVSEMMATSRGLGWYIDQEYQNNKIESLANIIVCIFIIGLIGALLDRIMFVLQKSVSFNEDEVSA